MFSPDEATLEAGQDPYVIMLPPPNITGSLHLGHALQDTIMDILARYQRLQGRPVLWLPGTDSAAIATNKVIEGQLADEGKTRHEIGREAFLERVEAWYAKTGADILNQMKRLGTSCDWSRNRFTMDQDYIAAVNEAFVRYYEQGYIYRGSRIVNWDPATQTTVSDLEIDWQTEKAPFYTFKYGPFKIGTVRPETKFGDKYVVMHPADERYATYQHGDTFEAEWINGPITATVIKDEASDPAMGTGVMTITPWHSAADFEIAQRHNLEMEQIIDFEGKLLPIAGEFAGQTIAEARGTIVDKLDQKCLLVRVDEGYEHNVAVNDRAKGTIEPQVMRQWFVDMDKLRAETIEVAEKEIIRFVPPRWKKHFITWMEQVYDWNINRQIWLGHRLPVWWKKGTHGTDQEAGNFVVSIDPPAGEPGDEYEQDPDVLDTWFATALWPFATLGWSKNTEDLKRFYPSSVLVTARDILYLWVARMIFSGLDLMKDKEYGRGSAEERIPFKDVFIYPTVLAKDGRRMSKSLGTGIDPLELIEEYGADATRFGLVNQTSYDNHAIKFDESDVVAGRNFANKLWNIARLVESLPLPEGESLPQAGEGVGASSVADTWIQHRQQATQQQVSKLIEAYKIGEALRVLYDFVWKDLADWYLEIAKVQGSSQVARDVLNRTLIMLHPFTPFITEVLWRQAGNEGQLIAAHWPMTTSGESPAVTLAEEAMGNMHRLQDIVTTVRRARALLALPAGAPVSIFVAEVPLPEVVAKLARVDLATSKTHDMKEFPLAGGGSVGVASEHITEASVAAAKEQLTKERDELTAQIAKHEQIITGMRGKAPAEVVAAKETELDEVTQALKETEQSLRILA